MAKIYSAVIFLLFSANAFSASCCGGGQSAASLIIADHLQEWTFSTLLRRDIGQTNNDGKALMDDDNNRDQTLTASLEYKKLFKDRFQGNVGLSFTEKNAKRLGKKEKDTGLGDFSLGVFYEAITNYTYSTWAPRLFLGAKITVPFGENNFNSEKNLRTDIRGSGFYKIDLPIVMVRGDFKGSLAPQYFPKQKYLNSTYGFSTAGTYTYSLSSEIDFSSTLQWNYLAKKKHQGQSLIASQFWEVSLSPSWAFQKDVSLNLNYSDSTLLGKSRNSALYRSVSIGMTWSELI